jgi:hypothetical protein
MYEEIKALLNLHQHYCKNYSHEQILKKATFTEHAAV